MYTSRVKGELKSQACVCRERSRGIHHRRRANRAALDALDTFLGGTPLPGGPGGRGGRPFGGLGEREDPVEPGGLGGEAAESLDMASHGDSESLESLDKDADASIGLTFLGAGISSSSMMIVLDGPNLRSLGAGGSRSRLIPDLGPKPLYGFVELEAEVSDGTAPFDVEVLGLGLSVGEDALAEAGLSPSPLVCPAGDVTRFLVVDCA